jgi:hypothetical protein
MNAVTGTCAPANRAWDMENVSQRSSVNTAIIVRKTFSVKILVNAFNLAAARFFTASNLVFGSGRFA